MSSANNSQFGVHLHRLQPLNDSNVPVALETCLTCIESNGGLEWIDLIGRLNHYGAIIYYRSLYTRDIS